MSPRFYHDSRRSFRYRASVSAEGEHAVEDHGMEVTPELVEKVKGAIRKE
jgi:hypothetical protein